MMRYLSFWEKVAFGGEPKANSEEEFGDGGGEGVERRDAIDKYSDGDDGDIDRNEEAQGCSDDGGAS